MNDQTNEVAPKKEIIVNPGTNPFPRENTLTTNIGYQRGSDEKHEVYFFLPVFDGDCDKLNEELKEHYNLDINGMVEAAVRKISTSPNFKTCFNEDGTLPEGGHAAMQAMADEYKVGQRSAATGGMKAKAAKLDALETKLAALGMTLDEFMAKTAEV